MTQWPAYNDLPREATASATTARGVIPLWTAVPTGATTVLACAAGSAVITGRSPAYSACTPSVLISSSESTNLTPRCRICASASAPPAQETARVASRTTTTL